MKKFTYPSLAVIALNAEESVMNAILSTGEHNNGNINYIDHLYEEDDSYQIWQYDYKNK
ncbi:MAG: hypothetical protein J1F63_04435 [Oscillospiraceae bacterium]|nr:hypothetical protein [Oscillospiraceae bacterium]